MVTPISIPVELLNIKEVFEQPDRQSKSTKRREVEWESVLSQMSLRQDSMPENSEMLPQI